jgi:prolyl oligopeptidase
LEDLPDELSWVKFSGILWSTDSAGFFYTKWDEPEDETLHTAGTGNQKLEYPKIMYHRLGDDQSEDTVIYERPDDP